ncbi:hypothetical protein [Paenibacillus sp. 8b26]|uniref:hypothetical protein n=1 Tax=Paenibacillus sp. 8b26 TaxID=3424133 RepID=UPI003D6556F1
MLQSMKSISKELAERWESEISKLNTGERVAASIIHEYGHILTFRAWGNMGIKNTLDVYDWLDEYGYLDNFSKRIVSFNEGDAPWQINVAIEQLAEDFRLALDVKNQNGACCLPHIITYQQDLLNPEGYLEGVDIMKNLLQFDGKLKKGRVSGALDSIIPFGEANRSSLPTNFIHGEITPLTQEDKDRAREKLKQFEVDF